MFMLLWGRWSVPKLRSHVGVWEKSNSCDYTMLIAPKGSKAGGVIPAFDVILKSILFGYAIK